MEETCTARDTKEPTAPTDTQRQRRWRVALQLLLIIMQIYILVKKVCTHYSFADELESKFMQEQKDSHIGRLGGDLIGLFQTNLLL